jgi:hypothetical protein
MKKLAIFLAIMLIPFSAFALDTISDSDLDSVTGQAGVSIFTNSIQIVKTGITTTYTDIDGANNSYTDPSQTSAGNFSIVSGQTVTQIYFKGYDPINIDVIDKDDTIAIINAAAAYGAGGAANLYGGALTAFNTALYAGDELGTSGVQITLPNAIVVNNIASTKTYYAGSAADIVAGEEEMIRISTNGGSTTYSIAYIPQGGTFANAAAYVNFCDAAQWSNVLDGNLAAVGVDHADQIKIVITSHE